MTEKIEEKTNNEKKKIAIVTYNRIGEGQFDNGVMELPNADLYIAQNGHRAKWAAEPYETPNIAQVRERAATRTAESIELKAMDHTYLYVGARGSEETIKATSFLPADKVTYVLCDCNYSGKKSLINNVGNTEAEIKMCECGGRNTLESITKRLIQENQ